MRNLIIIFSVMLLALTLFGAFGGSFTKKTEGFYQEVSEGGDVEGTPEVGEEEGEVNELGEDIVTTTNCEEPISPAFEEPIIETPVEDTQTVEADTTGDIMEEETGETIEAYRGGSGYATF